MRGYNKSFNRYNALPSIGERVIAVLTYLTAGFIGFLWLIFAFITKNHPSTFVKFHIYQSIFLSILYYIASIVLRIIIGFASVIPFINKLMYKLIYITSEMPLILGYPLIRFLILAIVIYLVVTALRGKYGNLPWVSDMIKQMY